MDENQRKTFRWLGCGAGCLSCGCLPIILAVVGLWMSSISQPLLLAGSKFMNCRDAVKAEVQPAGTSTGPLTAGSSQQHTFRYYDMVCTYADGHTKVVPNDPFVLGGFAGAAIGGALLGLGIGLFTWFILAWLTRRRKLKVPA